MQRGMGILRKSGSVCRVASMLTPKIWYDFKLSPVIISIILRLVTVRIALFHQNNNSKAALDVYCSVIIIIDTIASMWLVFSCIVLPQTTIILVMATILILEVNLSTRMDLSHSHHISFITTLCYHYC